MAIKQFINKAAYDAASLSVLESTVSLMQDTGAVEFNGINQFVSESERATGDAVVLNASGEMEYIKGATINPKTLPDGYTTVGVLGPKYKGKYILIHKTDVMEGTQSPKWAEVWCWKIVPTLDGASHDMVMKADGTTALPTLSYTATTLEEFKTSFDAWLTTNAPGYHCYIEGAADGHFDEDTLILVWDAFNSYPRQTFSGVTATNMPHISSQPMIGSIQRKCGLKTSYGGANWARFYQYYKTSGKTPTSTVTTDPIDCLSEAGFNSDYATALQAKYGTYENYLRAQMCVYPTNLQTSALGHTKVSDGDLNTTIIRAAEYKDKDGNWKALCTADYLVSLIGYNDKKALMLEGNWRMPSISELVTMMADVTYGTTGINAKNCDIVNRSLFRINSGSSGCLSATGRWSCSRFSAQNAWIYSSSGYASYSYLYFRLRTRPILLLD